MMIYNLKYRTVAEREGRSGWKERCARGVSTEGGQRTVMRGGYERQRPGLSYFSHELYRVDFHEPWQAPGIFVSLTQERVGARRQIPEGENLVAL